MFIPNIYKIRDYFTHKNKLQIYFSYIYPVLTYLLPIWGVGYQKIIDAVQKLQNKILKILFKKDFLIHTETLYEDLQLKQISAILKFEQSKLIHKNLLSKQKTNLQLIFSESIHNYKTRNKDKIHTQFSRTNLGLFNPVYSASRTYNSLPSEIKENRNYNKFVNNLKQIF